MQPDFLKLFENGNFVELGLRIKNEFDRIDKEKMPKKAKFNKKNEIVKNIHGSWNPYEKSEEFFNLRDWEIDKLSFAVAVDTVSRGLTTSQIRKILNMSTKIYRDSKKGSDVYSNIVKLNYILAYTLGRQDKNKKEIEPIARVFGEVLPKFKKLEAKDYEKVHNFLQAVVAYHKLLGGRD